MAAPADQRGSSRRRGLGPGYAARLPSHAILENILTGIIVSDTAMASFTNPSTPSSVELARRQGAEILTG
jgi:hypothetical protein